MASKFEIKLWWALAPFLALSNPAYSDMDGDAKEAVMKQPCQEGKTVDQYLSEKTRHSQRDLGWRVFPADGGVDVERAFMASKAMEIRYRWRVTGQGQVTPANSRAENLCS